MEVSAAAADRLGGHLGDVGAVIQQRAEELLERVDRMDDEELRWTVRVFADCLSPDQRRANLGGYSEHQQGYTYARIRLQELQCAHELAAAEETYWANGACMMIRASLIREIGLLDRNLRFVCSDADYSFTARARGWTIFSSRFRTAL